MTILVLITVSGAGSTPLHYAACGGNLKCCQVRTLVSLFFCFFGVVEKKCCENLHFLCFSIDSPCKRCKKDDIELQWVNHNLLMGCFVFKTSFGEIFDVVRMETFLFKNMFVGGYLLT